jgi:hypothetical protein
MISWSSSAVGNTGIHIELQAGTTLKGTTDTVLLVSTALLLYCISNLADIHKYTHWFMGLVSFLISQLFLYLLLHLTSNGIEHGIHDSRCWDPLWLTDGSTQSWTVSKLLMKAEGLVLQPTMRLGLLIKVQLEAFFNGWN